MQLGAYGLHLPTPKSNRFFLVLASIAGIAVGLAVLAAPALAQIWTEQGDAGDLVSTAQSTSGNGVMTSIHGTLLSPNDVDMYCIHITDPVVFSANFLCLVYQDTHLWLFNPAGIGLAHDDGCMFGQTGVWTPFVPPSAGTYYLAVGGYGALALNGTNPIWTYNAGNPIPGQRAPDGPAAALPLTGWSGGAIGPYVGANYAVRLSGVEFCEPGVTKVRAHTWGQIRGVYH